VQKPVEGGEEAVKSAQEIGAIDKKLETLKQETEKAEFESAALTLATENLRQARQTIDRHVNALTGLRAKFDQMLEAEGIAFEDVVSVSASYGKIDAVIATKELVFFKVLGQNLERAIWRNLWHPWQPRSI